MPRRSFSPAANDRLDKEAFTPLYYQIQQRLMDRIRSGNLRAGDPLESEEDLAGRYQVSRMTARQALQDLKAQGYAYSVKGRGTFVSRPKMEKNILHLQGFTEEMKLLGFKPGSRVLEQVTMIADETLAGHLKLRAGERVLKLSRLRLADDTPMALEHFCLPLERFPGIEKVDFSHASLYATLRKSHHVRVGWADEIIEALNSSPEQAHLLMVAPRSPLLSITRVVNTVQGTPIEYGHSLYRGDRYRAVLRVPATSIR